ETRFAHRPAFPAGHSCHLFDYFRHRDLVACVPSTAATERNRNITGAAKRGDGGTRQLGRPAHPGVVGGGRGGSPGICGGAGSTVADGSAATGFPWAVIGNPGPQNIKDRQGFSEF